MQVEAGTAIRMTIKGQSYLQPGQIISFKVRPVEPDGQTVDRKTYDPQYSGRYVITKIRHQVNSQKYTMALECAKDSVKYGFSQSDFKVERNPNIPNLTDTYGAEEPAVDSNEGHLGYHHSR